MTFDELISDLAGRVGVDGGFSADADGVVRVEIDGFVIAFRDVPEGGQLLMWCRFGEAPSEDERVRTAEDLLRANFRCRGGRGVLSLGEDGALYAHRYVPLAGLDADGFVAGALEDFLRLLSARTQGDAEFGESGMGREHLVEADVCAVPETGREKFLGALARANFMGQGAAGGALAVSDDGRVVLYRYLSEDGLTDEAREVALETLAATVLEWRRIADDYGPAAERAARTETEANDLQERALCGGVMRV